MFFGIFGGRFLPWLKVSRKDLKGWVNLLYWNCFLGACLGFYNRDDWAQGNESVVAQRRKIEARDCAIEVQGIGYIEVVFENLGEFVKVHGFVAIDEIDTVPQHPNTISNLEGLRVFLECVMNLPLDDKHGP